MLPKRRGGERERGRKDSEAENKKAKIIRRDPELPTSAHRRPVKRTGMVGYWPLKPEVSDLQRPRKHEVPQGLQSDCYRKWDLCPPCSRNSQKSDHEVFQIRSSQYKVTNVTTNDG